MSSLKAFQEEIKNLVFYREKEKEESFLWKDKVPARLDVYKNNTRLNWSDALDQDFPMTCCQFTAEDWQAIKSRYFIKHPPEHWELNTALTPFSKFLATQKISPSVKELADYEWFDLQTFISRAEVRQGTGVTNPTFVARVYQHQIFDWVEAGAPKENPPRQAPEVLAFYRDSKNTCHIQDADPLMLLLVDHFRIPGARLETAEPIRQKLLPQNEVPLHVACEKLKKEDIIL